MFFSVVKSAHELGKEDATAVDGSSKRSSAGAREH